MAGDVEMDSDDQLDKIESVPVRIVIVDDHIVVREGLRMLIETQDDMEVVAQAGTFTEAVAVIKREEPDIVVLDLDLGGINIVEQLPEIVSASQGTRVLVLTGVRDTLVHRRALRLGARGLVMKDQATETLLKAVRKINAGEAWIDHSMTANLLAEITGLGVGKKTDRESAKTMTLSRREREIVTVLCEGMSNKQIAKRLFISESTVRNHLTSILGKLELTDRFELAIYSYRHGLARPPA